MVVFEGKVQHLGRQLVEALVQRAEVLAEEFVKVGVMERGVPRTKPPKPIRAFSGKEGFPGTFVKLGVFLHHLASLSQQLPGTIFDRITDPSRKISLDPRATVKVRRLKASCGGILLKIFRDGNQFNAAVLTKTAVKLMQKRCAIFGVVAPAVFAIKGNRHQPRLVTGQPIANGLQTTDQIASRRTGRHRAITKANQIREPVIAENYGQIALGQF